MPTPLVSIVIPTHGRPQYLPRAVDSALTCHGEDAEVIVVPNGPDESWRDSLATWMNDSRVRISPIAKAHGNAARNHGMALARGRYLRFLDDDDYLLPEASDQISILESMQSDICSGLVLSVDQDDRHLGILRFPSTRDFVCAAAEISSFTLPVGNVYRLQSLSGCTWDETVHRSQDYAWMLDLACKRKWIWSHCSRPVGVWFQHKSPRTSTTTRLKGREEAMVQRLALLYKYFRGNGDLNDERRLAIAEGLWYYVHRGFPNHPMYWSRIGSVAQQISPLAKPRFTYFQTAPFANIPPLLIEWLLLPLRMVSQLFRVCKERLGGLEYRRKL